MTAELSPIDREVFLQAGVRASLRRVGIPELRRVGLVKDGDQATLGCLALSEGLGGVQLRRYGLPLSVVEQDPSLPAVHDQLHTGPWPLLVEALPWTLGLGVAEESRRDHRLLMARLLVLAFGQRELEGLPGGRPVVIDRCEPGWRISWPGEGRLPGSSPSNPRIASILAQLVEDPDPRDLDVLVADLGYRLDSVAEEGGVRIALWRDRDRVARMSSRRTRLPREQRHQRILQALRDLDGEASLRALQASSGLARSTLNEDLKVLVEEGKVQRTEEAPRSAYQAYRLTRPGGPHG